MIRILIADDTNLIRQALKIHFQLEPNFDVVGIAENGKIALQLVAELNPDIVIMDLEMPEMDGIAATQIIRQFFPRTRVLIISSHQEKDYVQQSLRSGANGYFIKSTPAKELSKAIRLIYVQNVNIIPSVSKKNSYVILPNYLPSRNINQSKFYASFLASIKKLLQFIYQWIDRQKNLLFSKF